MWDSGTWGSDEDTGNYLFVKAANVPEDAVVTVELINGVHGPTTLDSDLNIIIRITNPATQKIKVTSSLNGYTSTKIYNLSGLTLEPEPSLHD